MALAPFSQYSAIGLRRAVLLVQFQECTHTFAEVHVFFNVLYTDFYGFEAGGVVCAFAKFEVEEAFGGEFVHLAGPLDCRR